MANRGSLKNHLGTWLRSRGLHSESADTRIRAIERLAGASDPQAIALLTEALSDPDLEARVAAALALKERGTSEAIDPLVSALHRETEYDVLAALAGALVELDHETATRTLMSLLDDDDASVRSRVASLLRTALWDRLDDSERAHVAIVQDAWEEIADLGSAAIPALEAVVQQGTPHAKREAAEVLGRIATPEAHGSLSQMLTDTQLEVACRETVAWALKKFYWQDLSKTEHAWIGILDGDWPAVIDLGDTAVDPLADVLTCGPRDTRRPAVETLAKIGGARTAEILCRVLADKGQEVNVREIAVRAVGAIGGDNAIPTLAATLGDEAWVVREAAAVSLRNLQWSPTDDTQRALYAIANKDWACLTALGEAAIQPLADALKYGAVGVAAARVLLEIGQAGLDTLLVVLRDGNQSMGVREVVAGVLAKTGDPRAIAPVEAMLSEHDIVVRQVAVWTLTRLGWKPTNDNQKALVAIANEDWDELGNLGSAAVEPLLALAADSLAPDETVNALRRVLELSAPRLSTDELRTIAVLGDIQARNRLMGAKYHGAGGDIAAAVNCRAVRELACAELAHRGIMV